MPKVSRPAGAPACVVESVTLGRGFDIPAGPCELEVPEEIVAAIPGAVVLSEKTTPAAPAEE